MSDLSAQPDQTEEIEPGPSEPESPLPGLIVVFSGNTPLLRVLVVTREPFLFGRFRLEDPLPDKTVSREHARISFDGQQWAVEDLDSTNGSFVNGQRVRGSLCVASPRVLRFGNTVALPVADVRPFLQGKILTHDGFVRGPKTSKVFDQIVAVARSGGNLLIYGETGTGKEAAARAFAEGCGPGKSVNPVNSATLTESLMLQQLFGAERGSYTGSIKDREGVVKAARGGVLFLDEVGELKPEVQPMLLRLIQEKEIFPVGASVPQKVDVHFCFATHRDLHEEMKKGAFRPDLFFRISERSVTLPSLRERPEEIPSLLASRLAQTRSALVPEGSFVEACILRRWPGNIRELFNAVTQASEAAQAAGRQTLRGVDLDPYAGQEITRNPPPVEPTPPPPGARRSWPSAEEVERALQNSKGKLADARRELGLKHSEELRRLIERYGLRAATTKDDEESHAHRYGSNP